MTPIILPDVGNVAPWQNIFYVRNTTWVPPFNLTQGVGGIAFSIPNGARILFLVKTNPLDPDPIPIDSVNNPLCLLAKDNLSLNGIVVLSQVGGTTQIVFGIDDCSDFGKFPEGVPLYYSIKLFVSTNPEQVLLNGSFTVNTTVIQKK